MPDPKFKIIFDSRQVAASEHEALKTRFKTRLRLDDADLARLFDGRPVVIQRNLGQGRANALLDRFNALGAPCRIEAQPPPRATAQLSDSLVVCPKCQHSQPPAEECHRCGLIFSKYVTGKRVKTAPKPEETEKGMDSDPTPEEKTQPPPPVAPPPIAKLLTVFNSIRARLEAPFRQGRSEDVTMAKGPQVAARPYLQTVLSQGLRVVIYAIIAFILLVVGMWFTRGLWLLYNATQVGEAFSVNFPHKARAIEMMLSQHTLLLPLATILATLVVCTPVGTAGQFLHLGRYFYHHRPWWWRLLLWHLPLAGAGGSVLHAIGLAPSMKLGGALALLPTLCLAPVAFDLGQALICEVGDLLARLRALLHHPMSQLRDRIASHLNR